MESYLVNTASSQLAPPSTIAAQSPRLGIHQLVVIQDLFGVLGRPLLSFFEKPILSSHLNYTS
jgi:hypothetical protein